MTARGVRSTMTLDVGHPTDDIRVDGTAVKIYKSGNSAHVVDWLLFVDQDARPCRCIRKLNRKSSISLCQGRPLRISKGSVIDVLKPVRAVTAHVYPHRLNAAFTSSL